MSATDFCRVFTVLHVCGSPPTLPGHTVSMEGAWTESTAGGTWHHRTWLQNPQYALHMYSDAELMISVRQVPDLAFRSPRLWGGAGDQNSVGRQHNSVRVSGLVTGDSGETCVGPTLSPLPAAWAKPPGVGFIVLHHPFTPGATRFVDVVTCFVFADELLLPIVLYLW